MERGITFTQLAGVAGAGTHYDMFELSLNKALQGTLLPIQLIVKKKTYKLKCQVLFEVKLDDFIHGNVS